MKNMKKRVTIFIMALLITFMSVLPINVLTVKAATNNPQSLEELFDAQFYAYKYPEVVSVIGNDEAALFNHFVQYGLNEGRTCSPFLNVSQYRDNYQDVAQTYNSNWDDIVKHYFNNGINEGRQSFVSPEDIAIKNALQNGISADTQAYNSAILESIDGVIANAANSASGYTLDSATGIVASADGYALVPFAMVQKEGRIQDIDELARRCGNDFILIRDSYDRIKFVGGRFSAVQVKDESSALAALDTMADLYNFDTDRNYLKLSTTGTDSLGNPFYRFVSVDGADGSVNSDYTVTLSADKDGNVLGVSNANISSLEKKNKINDTQELLDYEKEYYEDPANGFTKLYDEAKLLYDDDTKIYYWAYYYERAGIVYEILVNKVEGQTVEYTRKYDADTFHNEPSKSFNGDHNFKNLSTLTEKSFIDFYGNEVILPVAYDEGKGWYIVDPVRNMLCVERTKAERYKDIAECSKHYFSDEYFNAVNEYLHGESEANALLEGEKTIISAFTTIQMSYDENKALGMLENPRTIYINFIYDDTDDNASQLTYNNSIEFNVNNNIGNADFAGMAHEFGHAVVANQGQNIPYQAATGAINESYADIIGNLLKMIKKKEGQYAGHVDFERWLIGEFLGNDTEHVIRDMSDPSLNKEGPSPTKVNDAYFIKDTGEYTQANDTDDGNDLGGVHQNNSILSNICYRMYNEVFAERDANGFGIPDANKYRDLLQVWYDSVIYLNHDSTYSDVKGYILQSMKNHGYSSDLLSQTEQIFNDANVDDYKPFDREKQNAQGYDAGDLAVAARVGAKVGGFDELSNLIEGEIASDDAKLAYEIAYDELRLAQIKGLSGDELKQYENNLEIAYNAIVLSEKNADELQNAFEDSQARLKKMVDDKMTIVSEQEKELKNVAAQKETNPNLERAYRTLAKGLKSNINDVNNIIDSVEEAATEFKDLDEISDVFSDVWSINIDSFDDEDALDYFDGKADYLYFDDSDYLENLDAWDYYDYWDDFWAAYWEDDDYWYGNDQEWDDDYNYYDENYSDEDYFSDWYYDDDYDGEDYEDYYDDDAVG